MLEPKSLVRVGDIVAVTRDWREWKLYKVQRVGIVSRLYIPIAPRTDPVVSTIDTGAFAIDDPKELRLRSDELMCLRMAADAPILWTVAYEGTLNVATQYSQARLYYGPGQVAEHCFGLGVRAVINVFNPWPYKLGDANGPLARVGIVATGYVYYVEEVSEGEPVLRIALAGP